MFKCWWKKKKKLLRKTEMKFKISFRYSLLANSNIVGFKISYVFKTLHSHFFFFFSNYEQLKISMFSTSLSFFIISFYLLNFLPVPFHPRFFCRSTKNFIIRIHSKKYLKYFLQSPLFATAFMNNFHDFLLRDIEIKKL